MTKEKRNLIGFTVLGINFLALWDILQNTPEDLYLKCSILSLSVFTVACYTILKQKN